MKRDGACKSLWQHNMAGYQAKEKENAEAGHDVLIVGAGITGLTTALLLQKAGKRCIIAEANSVAFGTTGGTTAHLNTFFDSPYSEVIKNFGEEHAKLLSKAGYDAIGLIKKHVEEFDIDCEFEEREAYNFSLDEKQDEILDDIVRSGKQLGLPIDYINDSPFPIPYSRIARVLDQAQFNPVKYVMALARAFEELGGVIIQECRVTSVDEGDIIKAGTTKGVINARTLIYATHIPPGVNVLHFRCAPYRSYAIAVKLKDGKYPKALGYDMSDPYHYYRSQVIDGEEYLIAGGEDHKTGHEENTEACFRKLESYVRQWFEVDEVAFRWSSQYYEPADGLPYIGHLPGSTPNVFVATGYNGNGMIFGTLAGLIFTDIITKGSSEYQQLFNPNRLKPVAGFSNFVKEAADVVKEFVKGIFTTDKIKELSDMATGEAKVVKYEGHKIALYKDEHQVHAVNPTCTHVKCTVGWNSAEKTWDCPCHGARYTCDGIVLTGPAQKDLEKIDLAETQTGDAVKLLHNKWV